MNVKNQATFLGLPNAIDCVFLEETKKKKMINHSLPSKLLDTQLTGQEDENQDDNPVHNDYSLYKYKG